MSIAHVNGQQVLLKTESVSITANNISEQQMTLTTRGGSTRAHSRSISHGLQQIPVEKRFK